MILKIHTSSFKTTQCEVGFSILSDLKSEPLSSAQKTVCGYLNIIAGGVQGLIVLLIIFVPILQPSDQISLLLFFPKIPFSDLNEIHTFLWSLEGG